MKNFNEKFIHDEFLSTSFFELPKLTSFQLMEADSYQNYHFIKLGSGEKIQIVFRINPTGVLVKDEIEGKYTISILGNEKNLTETILYKQKEPKGILQKYNEQWFVKKIGDSDDMFMETLTARQEDICKGDKLYSNHLCEIISLISANFVVNSDSNSDKCIDFTVWNSSFSGENGLFHSLNTTNADKVLFVSFANADDFSMKSDPAIVLKDGNYVLSQEERQDLCSFCEHRNFYVGKTDNIMEKLDLYLYDKKLLGLYIPISDLGRCIEEISYSNLEKTLDLLLKCIEQM